MQTHMYVRAYAHTHAHAHKQTLLRSTARRIWSLFKSLNYSWLKIHGEPFIGELGAVQAALWCLIGLKVANPLNKSGRRVVADCVLRIRMWAFTTHLPFISPPLFVHCPPAFVYSKGLLKPQKRAARKQALYETTALYLWYTLILL